MIKNKKRKKGIYKYEKRQKNNYTKCNWLNFWEDEYKTQKSEKKRKKEK